MLQDKQKKESADTVNETEKSSATGRNKISGLASTLGQSVGSAPTILAFAVFCLLLLTENMASANYVNSTNPYLSTMVLQLCIFVVPCAFYCTIRRVRVKNACRIRIPGVKGLSVVLCAVPAIVFATIAAKYIQCYVFGVRLGSAISLSGSGDSLYVLLSYALVPAIAEEICFRGLMLSEYEKNFGKIAAVATTSVLFAMMHFNLRDFTAYLIAGIIIGITVCATDSVVSAMLLHFCVNSVAVYTDNFIVKISSDTSAGRFALVIVTVLFLAFAMLWLYRLEVLYSDLAKKQETREKNKHGNSAEERMRAIHPDRGLLKSLLKIVATPAFVCVCIAFLIKIATE